MISDVLTYNYHPKKPNTTQKKLGLRRSSIDLRVGAHPTTIDYRHKTIVNMSRGEVVTNPNKLLH